MDNLWGISFLLCSIFFFCFAISFGENVFEINVYCALCCTIVVFVIAIKKERRSFFISFDLVK